MDALSLGLIVAAALVHATWNLLAKKASGGPIFVFFYSGATAVIYLPVIFFVDIFPAGVNPVYVLIAFGVSAILHLAYSLALQTGYQRANLSIVYPVARGTGPALSVAGAILIVGEPATWAGIAGAGLIVAGVLWIGLGGSKASHAESRVSTGLFWGGLTGLCIAGYTVVDGAVVKLLLLSPIALDYFANLLRLTMLAPLALKKRTELKSEWSRYAWLAVVVGALSPLSYIFVLYAMQRAPISVIAPARELSMMVGVFFGWWFMKEPDVWRRLAGAALIAAGVMVLARG
jgi:drug/metabolite transporter (DMT)-like permease